MYSIKKQGGGQSELIVPNAQQHHALIKEKNYFDSNMILLQLFPMHSFLANINYCLHAT